MKTKTNPRSLFKELQGTTQEIIHQVKKLIKKGQIRRILIKNKKGKVMFQSQLNIGAAGATAITLISPVVAAISFFAVVLSDMNVVVEKYPETQGKDDDYEVEARIIEIEDEEDKSASGGDETDKTVGKNEKQ